MASDAEVKKELFGILLMSADQYIRSTERFTVETLQRVLTNRAAELRVSRDTKQVRRLIPEVLPEVVARIEQVFAMGMEAGDD